MVGLDEETLTTSLNGVRARKPPDWLIEERRSTLGHWAAFCLSCGHTLRYFEEIEQELPVRVPAVCWADPGALPLLQREVRIRLRHGVRGLRNRPAPGRAPRASDQAGRLTICENRITVTVSSSVISRL